MNNEKVKITVSDGYINGTIQGTIQGPIQGPIHSKNKHPAILVIHGLTSKEDKYITRFQDLAKKGYICLTISLRGHGESSGSFKTISRQSHLEDIYEAFNYLKSLDSVDENRIGIYGKSYGGYLTAIVSSKINPKTIILGAPALYENGEIDECLHSILNRDLEAWRKFNLDSNQNYALKSLSAYKGNTLILVFGKDIEVPKATTDTYIKLKKSIIVETIKDSNHGLDNPIWDKQAMGIINKWFENNL